MGVSSLGALSPRTARAAAAAGGAARAVGGVGGALSPRRVRGRAAAAGGASALGGAACAPADVLTFWFGPEWELPPATRNELMNTPEYLKPRYKLWFFGSDAFDNECRAFEPLLAEAEAANGEPDDKKRGESLAALAGEEWLEGASADARVARLVLLDQIARNARRGTQGAFVFDAEAAALARRMIVEHADTDEDKSEVANTAVLGFVSTALMHSECLTDHLMLRDLLDVGAGGWRHVADQRGFADSHRAVIERFGRYPHRNGALGRQNSPEEAAWLDSDEVPGWARSQAKLSRG